MSTKTQYQSNTLNNTSNQIILKREYKYQITAIAIAIARLSPIPILTQTPIQITLCLLTIIQTQYLDNLQTQTLIPILVHLITY
jgi:hypothetical protein